MEQAVCVGYHLAEESLILHHSVGTVGKVHFQHSSFIV